MLYVMSTMHETRLLSGQNFICILMFHTYVWYNGTLCGLVVQLTHLVETMLLTFILLSRLCDLSVSLAFWQSRL